MLEFQEFEKISRLNREVIVTEKEDQRGWYEWLRFNVLLELHS